MSTRGSPKSGSYMWRKSRLLHSNTFFSTRNWNLFLRVKKSICVYVGPQHPLYHAESVDFSELPNLKFMRGVRDFFSMEHHLETVSMGVIDQSVMKHVIYSDSDHSIINFLLHTDVCSLGLNFMHRPYEQYDIKPLSINGCEPFLQIGYVLDPERPPRRRPPG